MGGNAHGINLARISDDNYKCICDFLKRSFRRQLNQEIIIPKHQPEKLNHGDIDIIIPHENKIENNKLETIGLINPIGGPLLKAQKHCLLRYNGLLVQVDITYMAQSEIPMALLLLQYGDLGMILGVHAKSIGCKLSTTGLYWIHKLTSPSTCEKKYLISNDPEKICEEYFGLDYNKWVNGFKSLYELYEWTIPIRPTKLQFEAAKNRENRKMYIHYKEWLAHGWGSRNLSERDVQDGEQQFRQKLFDPSKDIAHKLNEQIQHDEFLESQTRLFKSRFNGKNINLFRKECIREGKEEKNEEEIQELKGRDLGKYMLQVKALLVLDIENGIIPTMDDIKKAIRQI